jgi:hypothetical protein
MDANIFLHIHTRTYPRAVHDALEQLADDGPGEVDRPHLVAVLSAGPPASAIPGDGRTLRPPTLGIRHEGSRRRTVMSG